jgi:hypothetical protein
MTPKPLDWKEKKVQNHCKLGEEEEREETEMRDWKPD